MMDRESLSSWDKAFDDGLEDWLCETGRSSFIFDDEGGAGMGRLSSAAVDFEFRIPAQLCYRLRRFLERYVSDGRYMVGMASGGDPSLREYIINGVAYDVEDAERLLRDLDGVME